MSQRIAVIRYFTGTGNTKRVADCISAELVKAGDVVDGKMITDDAPLPAVADRYVFCSPVYALGLPRVFKRHLAGLPGLAQPKPAMLVVTAGNPEHTGWALRHGRELLDARGYKVIVSETIHMPDNWTPFLPAPSESVITQRLTAGDELAAQLAQDFLAGKEHHRPFSLKAMGAAGSWLVHKGFHGQGINRLWKLFKGNTNCTSCGLCARICPMHAIAMVDGKPKWSHACEQCCRCFNYCPERAIEQLDIIGKGSRRGRYHEPGFKP